MTAPDLFLLNARAGKHVGPYPHELPDPAPPRCANPGCTNPIAGGLTNNGLRRLHCSDECRRFHASRMQYARLVAAKHERRLGRAGDNRD